MPQPQDFFALRRGYRLLGLSTEAVPDFVYTVTAARRDWAEAARCFGEVGWTYDQALMLSLLDKMGVQQDKFGDSSSKLEI